LEDLLKLSVTVFMGFFAIMNPIANTPVFLGLTADDSPDVRRKVAARALLFTFGIILVFCAGGKFIFEMFGITLPAFRITGGVLVFLVGYQMLQGSSSSVHHPDEDEQQKSLESELDVAIAPLTMPILAGPGTIATAMNFASTGGLREFAVTVGAFFALCVITYGFFVSGQRFVTYLGEGGIKAVTRLMGLILAVIGVQMLITGIGGAVAAYATG
jgi:multiple antibiotic resistance protein